MALRNKLVGWGGEIFKARMARGLTQQELADQMGVTRQTIWRIENNVTLADSPTAKRVRQFLGIKREL